MKKPSILLAALYSCLWGGCSGDDVGSANCEPLLVVKLGEGEPPSNPALGLSVVVQSQNASCLLARMEGGDLVDPFTGDRGSQLRLAPTLGLQHLAAFPTARSARVVVTLFSDQCSGTTTGPDFGLTEGTGSGTASTATSTSGDPGSLTCTGVPVLQRSVLIPPDESEPDRPSSTSTSSSGNESSSTTAATGTSGSPTTDTTTSSSDTGTSG